MPPSSQTIGFSKTLRGTRLLHLRVAFGYEERAGLAIPDTQMKPGFVLIPHRCVLFQAGQKFGHQTDEEHTNRRSYQEAGLVIHT